MADTFVPVQGFLAGFFKAVGLTIGAVPVYQPLTNRDFETGDLTGWTDDSGAPSTAVATAAKGYRLGSYGCVLTDDGSHKAGISKIIVLDSAVSADQAAIWRLHASCWARFDAASDEATMKITCLSAADADLGNASVTMISKHPSYSKTATYGVDGFFSIDRQVVEATKKIKIEIFSNAAAPQVVNIDNVSFVVLEQVAGAFGPMGLPMGWEKKDVTTFATADDGFRSFASTIMKEGTMSLPAFWVASEGVGELIADEEDLYCVLWTAKATKTSNRFEFWGLIHGAEWSAAPGEIQTSNLSVTANGLIGYADR